jgi:dTDP-4-amino-4,6-dideoxygalactose transaminase
LHGMSRDAWKRYGQGGAWRYDVVRPGFKCNMTDIAAALGLVQLTRLGDFQARRREVVARYAAGLGDLETIELPSVRSGVESAWHLHPIRLVLDRLPIDRDRFIDEMAARNIGTSVHFIPLHLMSFYRDRYGLTEGTFPVATAEFERLVSLPLHPGLSDRDVDDVIEAVRDIVQTAR